MSARVVIACLIALAGCGKPASRTPSSPTATAEAGSPGQPSTAGDDARVAADLQELTQAVRRYGVEQRQAPKSLDELVNKGYIAAIPQAPAGKRYAINKQLQVYLATP